MKNFILTLSVLIMSIAAFSQINRTGAINVIADEVVGVDSLEIYHLYSKYEKMYQGDTLWLDNFIEHYIAPYQENWVFFVDRMPVAYWAHPCQIIFFNADSGDFTISNDDWPPDPFLGDMTQFLEEWERILSVGTEVQTSDKNIFKITPNPFTDEISINCKNIIGKELSINIFDISGKIILTTTHNMGFSENEIIKLNTSDIKPGIYLIQIQNNNKTVFVEKLVK